MNIWVVQHTDYDGSLLDSVWDDAALADARLREVQKINGESGWSVHPMQMNVPES